MAVGTHLHNCTTKVKPHHNETSSNTIKNIMLHGNVTLVLSVCFTSCMSVFHVIAHAYE
jgi:hypothetical protein